MSLSATFRAIPVALFLVSGALPALSAEAQPSTPALVPLPTANDEILRAAAEAQLAMEFHGSTAAEFAAWQQAFAAKLRALIGPHTG